ncbi:MAG TPA: GMC family oxidoreductase N-terminal domain-containing protein [Vicinamibacterales bacterium]|nr:GMC family oxidoreductase N-terminal domain-containing protein [Vicinamibacterales bacterium]
MKRREFIKTVGVSVAAAASTTRGGRAQPAAAFDFVVIGAGSSGCVVANRLSADPAHRVLLIEAGGPSANEPAISTPARWVSLMGSAYDWNYETEPEPGLDGRRLRWPRGKAVGGSSAINAMAYVRGHQASFDAWAETAGPAWSYGAVLPVFRRLEDNSRGASEYHGAGGPLAVADTTDPHAGHLAFLEAAGELGYAADPRWDFNGAQQENGAGFYQKNIINGRRHSAADAFLLPVLGRSNLTVWSRTTARRLLFEHGRVTAVELGREGRVERVAVAREVVLASGVIESPKLLMLSGIGPADALKPLGIQTVVDAPDVGAHLHDHPRVSLRWASQRPLPGSSVSAGLLVHSQSPGAPPSEARMTAPDLQFYVGRGLDEIDEFITLTVALSGPRSRGTVRLRSASPDDLPIIRAGYFSDRADLDALVTGVRLARSLAETRAYTGLRGAAIDPAAGVQTADALRGYVRRAADTIFHPVGTCRMGLNDRSVVDPTLRVRGVEGVRVADGSVMPVSVNSQTHAACVMIGERAADFILG